MVWGGKWYTEWNGEQVMDREVVMAAHNEQLLLTHLDATIGVKAAVDEKC